MVSSHDTWVDMVYGMSLKDYIHIDLRYHAIQNIDRDGIDTENEEGRKG